MVRSKKLYNLGRFWIPRSDWPLLRVQEEFSFHSRRALQVWPKDKNRKTVLGSGHEESINRPQQWSVQSNDPGHAPKGRIAPPSVWRIALSRLAVQFLGWKDPADKMKVYVTTGEMYRRCSCRATKDGDEASRRFWFDDCEVQQSFASWFQITELHIWMLMVRLRALPSDRYIDGRSYQQGLVDHLFADSEGRLQALKFNQRLLKTTILDLVQQCHGSVLAYDEGMCKDDAVLAAAIWRNIFAGGLSAKNLVGLQRATRYVRNNLYMLNKLSDKEVLQGNIKFLDPE